MSRKNATNIKKYNDKLHKEKSKASQDELARKEKLKQMVRKFNENNKEQ